MYSGRDLARDTYHGIKMQPARRVRAAAPMQPRAASPVVPWYESGKVKSIVASSLKRER